MWAPFVAAVLVGALAPYARAIIWRVPFSMLSWKQTLRVTLSAGLSTLFAAVISLVALEPHTAALMGFSVGAALTLSSARRHRHERGTVLLAYRLRQELFQEDAKKALDARFERYANTCSPQRYANLASIAVLPMSALGIWDSALKILNRIELDALKGNARARHGQALATCHMASGDLERATDILAQLERPASDAIERWIVALEALLFAIQGASERALALVDVHDDGEGALGASYAIVRAHAYACDAHEKRARNALDEAVAIAGRDALRRAIRPVGPATDIARTMLVDAG